MLSFRSPLTSTKKLFHRTIQSVKSLFSKKITYQRLPKTPPFNPFTCVGCHGKSFSQSYTELDIFYSDFTTWFDGEIDANNNIVSSTSPAVEVEKYHEEKIEKDEMKSRCLVTEKLKELEMIDSSDDLENIQDIEEVLYLYSHITCQVYVDIFDKFVMDIYSDIYDLKALRKKTISSTSRLHHSSFL